MLEIDIYSTSNTFKICMTVAFLGLLFFLFKIKACEVSNLCSDEFKVKTTIGYPSCSPGATIEVVNVPEPGIICHCQHSNLSSAPPTDHK